MREDPGLLKPMYSDVIGPNIEVGYNLNFGLDTARDRLIDGQPIPLIPTHEESSAQPNPRWVLRHRRLAGEDGDSARREKKNPFWTKRGFGQQRNFKRGKCGAPHTNCAARKYIGCRIVMEV